MALNWIQQRALLLICLMVLLGVSLYYIYDGWFVAKPLDAFTECVGATGTTLYIQNFCDDCNKQLAIFGSSAKRVHAVNCTAANGFSTAAICEQKQIETYPTWVFTYGDQVTTQLSLDEISQRTGCSLPERQ